MLAASTLASSAQTSCSHCGFENATEPHNCSRFGETAPPDDAPTSPVLKMTATFAPLPDRLVFRRVGPGVYASADGRVTLYRIEGCYPAAWNVEWTTDYGNALADLDGDYSPGGIALSNLVDGAATKRDALALATDAWPALRARLAELEAAQ